MYKKRITKQTTIEDFFLPFGGELRTDNRWVVLADIVPWDLAESFYAEQFSHSTTGPSAKPARLALGALIIKERLSVSDEEAVEQIRENPYLQYFLGFRKFQDKAPFDPSMFVHFRKRFGLEQLSQINEALMKAKQESKSCHKDSDHSSTDIDPPSGSNKGKLVVDATCAPADIRYPTDTNLVNEAREKSEQIIDVLFKPLRGTQRKPRTYRRKARRLFLSYSKKRKHSTRQRRKVMRQQLGFLGRNLKTIAKLAEQIPLSLLGHRQYCNLLVIHEVYRQQLWMYENRCIRINDRIVSISQPHVRPIVRGKASASTEFGAKLSASLVDGFVFLDRLDWNSYNESTDLIGQIESYKQRFGYYPNSVHCDKIYRTRDNRKFCQKHSIRISGPPLGRPPKVTTDNATDFKAKKLQQRQDELDRIPIEGKFGQAKRRFGLNRIMAKLSETSETVMGVIFLVMNLEKWLKMVFLLLLTRLNRLGLAVLNVTISQISIVNRNYFTSDLKLRSCKRV